MECFEYLKIWILRIILGFVSIIIGIRILSFPTKDDSCLVLARPA